jgi:hypothetical protein
MGWALPDVLRWTSTAALVVMRVVDELDQADPDDEQTNARLGAQMDAAHNQMDAAGITDQAMIMWAQIVGQFHDADGTDPDGPAASLRLRAVPYTDRVAAVDPDDRDDWRARMSRFAGAVAHGAGWAAVDHTRAWAMFGDDHDRRATTLYEEGTASVLYSLAGTALFLARRRFGAEWPERLAPLLPALYLRHHTGTLSWAAVMVDRAARRLGLPRSAGYSAAGSGIPAEMLPHSDSVAHLLTLLDARLDGDEESGYEPGPAVWNVALLGAATLSGLDPQLAHGRTALTFDSGNGNGLITYDSAADLPEQPRHRGAMRVARMAAALAVDDRPAYYAAVRQLADEGPDAIALAATAAVDWLTQICQNAECEVMRGAAPAA